MLSTVLLGLHIVACLALIVFILMGKGAGLSLGGGVGLGGASQTVFGSQGSNPFITRLTRVLAAIFFATSIGLNLIKTDYQHSHADAIVKAAASAPDITPSTTQ